MYKCVFRSKSCLCCVYKRDPRQEISHRKHSACLLLVEPLLREVNKISLLVSEQSEDRIPREKGLTMNHHVMTRIQYKLVR